MLQVENINYRHAHAVEKSLTDISFNLSPGQTLLICGHSGSGKSTLLSILAGLVPHYFKGELSGRMSLNNENPAAMSLNDWGLRAGLMMQNPESQFVASTVEEEILLSLRCRHIPSDSASKIARRQLERFNLDSIAGQSVFDLSEGQKQKVVLAALSSLQPKLLLLDEPSANLDPKSINELAAILTELKNDGTSMVIADHRLYWLRELIDQVLILEKGCAIHQGAWKILEDESLRAACHLRPLEVKTTPIDCTLAASSSDESIQIRNLCFNYPGQPEILSNFNAELPLGKVTALTGPSGQGKTTLAKILCGLEKPVSGEIDFQIPSGIHGQVVLQNADHQLYMPTVHDEVAVGLRFGENRKIFESADDILHEFGLSQLTGRHPQSLSGGEKQRLVVAVGITSSNLLLILDEPTSGLDGYNLKLMSEQIKKIARHGLAVLVITHDFELTELCADFHITL